MPLQVRKVWLNVHRWLGLTVGLLFAFSGLTGSFVVFNLALDESLNSSLKLTSNHGTQMPVADIVAAAERQSPASGRVVNVFYPRVANGTFTLYFRDPDNSNKAETTEVFVDPVTTKILGQRSKDSGVMAWIYRLHSTLLAGESGKLLLGGLAVVALISVTSGLILWWPLIRKGLWIGFGIRQRTLLFDLHKSLGASFSVVLLLVAATGIYFTLPGLIKPLVTMISSETKLPTKVKSTIPKPRVSAIRPDAAAQSALAEMPGCRVMSIELPLKPADAYRVFVRQPGEVGQLRGVGRVWVDQYSGKVLATRDWRKFTFADTVFRIQLALHSGDAFGLVGRWLFCLAGLVPTFLYITGFLLWRRRGKQRQTTIQTTASQLTNTVPVPAELIATN